MDKASAAHYRLFDHTADLGMEIFGSNPRELFIHAGEALFDILVSGIGREPSVRRQRIALQGLDWADLMVNWLRELLYLFNGRRQVLVQLRMESLSENALTAEAMTCDFMPERHRMEKEIKAVTYHQVRVGPQGEGWRARVIFDI